MADDWKNPAIKKGTLAPGEAHPAAIFKKTRKSAILFAESGLPGPTKRRLINVYAPTARIGRILARELGLPVSIFWQIAAKRMLDDVSAKRKQMGDNPLPEALHFYQEDLDKKPLHPWPHDMFEVVAQVAERIRNGEAPE